MNEDGDRGLAQGRTCQESYGKLVLCLGAEPVQPGPVTLTSTATRSPGSR